MPYFQANESGAVERLRLTEIEPGLFLAWNGEALDLRTPAATWRSQQLVRLAGGPAPWQWILLGIAAVVALWWLLVPILSWARRRRPGAGPRPGAPHARWCLLAGAVATLTAALTLGTIALLVAIPRLVDAGFLGWLEVPLAERLLLHLPLALAIASACLFALTAILGWVRAWWPRAGQLEVRRARRIECRVDGAAGGLAPDRLGPDLRRPSKSGPPAVCVVARQVLSSRRARRPVPTLCGRALVRPA